METSSILCISISVQIFQYATKALDIYVLFIQYICKTKVYFLIFLLVYSWVCLGFFWRFDKDFPSSPTMESKTYYHNEKQNFKHEPQLNFSTILEELSIN